MEKTVAKGQGGYWVTISRKGKGKGNSSIGSYGYGELVFGFALGGSGPC